MRLSSTIYDKEPFEREREEVSRPDPADRGWDEKKEEALEKEYPMTFTNEQLTELVTKLREGVSLLTENAAADDKIIERLELRVKALEQDND